MEILGIRMSPEQVALCMLVPMALSVFAFWASELFSNMRFEEFWFLLGIIAVETILANWSLDNRVMAGSWFLLIGAFIIATGIVVVIRQRWKKQDRLHGWFVTEGLAMLIAGIVLLPHP